MFKCILTISILTIASLNCFSQNLLTGRILDFETNKPIKEVNISVDGRGIETVSNNAGYFQIKVDTSDFLIVEKPFYESGQVKVSFTNGMRILLKKRNEPEYRGGFDEFYKFFYINIMYPERATKKRTHGRVYVSFELDSLGKVKNIVTIKDIGNGCADEIVRLLKVVPNQWIPTENSSTFILPVTFRIGNTLEKIFEAELPQGILLKEIVVTAIGIGEGI